MLGMMIAALLAAAPAPGAEAEALGRRLAAAGTLASILPMMIEKDLADLAKEDPSLTDADRARLAGIGREQGRQGTDRLTAALGHSYAARLSLSDLKALVAQYESPAAGRFRAAMLPSVTEAMAAAGQIDLKKDVAAEFCRQAGKMCQRH